MEVYLNESVYFLSICECVVYSDTYIFVKIKDPASVSMPSNDLYNDISDKAPVRCTFKPLILGAP